MENLDIAKEIILLKSGLNPKKCMVIFSDSR